MKKGLITVLAILLVFGFFDPLQAFAHFPKTDGDITVTFHVDPDDNPVPDKPSYFYFLFNDSTEKFDLSSCNCIVSVFANGKKIYQAKLSENPSKKPSIWGASMKYTFPKRDIYKITLTGEPATPSAFQPFNLSWNFRVDQNEAISSVSKKPPKIPLVPILVAGIIFFTIFGWVLKGIIDSENRQLKK